MSTTYAPLPSALPAPVRKTDVFDFLHARKQEPTPEKRITVEASDSPDLVSVKIASADGRCLRRKVPADCWEQQDYRGALIRQMSLLVA